MSQATHVSSTELLFNWIPLLGATEPGTHDSVGFEQSFCQKDSPSSLAPCQDRLVRFLDLEGL